MPSRRDKSLEKFSRSKRNQGFGNRKGFFSAAEVKVYETKCSFCDNDGKENVVKLANDKYACEVCLKYITQTIFLHDIIAGDYIARRNHGRQAN